MVIRFLSPIIVINKALIVVGFMCRRGRKVMDLKGYLVVKLAFILVGVVSGNNSYGVDSNLNRNSFPQGFVFGSASSSYQVRLNFINFFFFFNF